MTLTAVRLEGAGAFCYAETAVRCRCGRVMAIRTPDGRFESRHRGRVYRLREGDEITCEDCRHTTALDKPLKTVLIDS